MADQLITLQQRLTLNDAEGTPIPSGTVTFYETGTTTRVTVYADEDYSTPLPNPLTADASGRIVPVYYNGSDVVDAVIRKEDGAFVDRLEQIPKFSTQNSGASAITFSPTTDNDKTNVQEALAYASEQAASAASQTIPISRGGTGATTKANALANLDIAFASQAQAEAGTDSATYMTPQRVEQAIEALAATSKDFGSNGGVNFRFGLQIRWGTESVSSTGTKTKSYSSSFDNDTRVVMTQVRSLDQTGAIGEPIIVTSDNADGFSYQAQGEALSPTMTFFYLAIGY